MASTKNSASRVEAITRRLQEAIFDGRYPPGSPLRELVLARAMRVSQATVREALRQLEHAGLVTREVNRGCTVTRLSPQNIRERVILRALLETMAAQAASAKMTTADFAELERRLKILEKAVRSDSYYEAAQADLDFHRYIWHCSGNTTLSHTLELITTPLFAFVSILRQQGLQRLSAVVDSHEPLIAALRSGNPEEIRRAFEHAATHAYMGFLDNVAMTSLTGAFGLLEVIGVR
jgi:DNA-binding GntR family transcriptional regulator